MTLTTYRLSESREVTLDSDGNGIVSLGPTIPSVTWLVETLSVSTSTNNRIPRAYVYEGTESPGNLLGGTENGSRDSMGPSVRLETNAYITVVWKGGDTGARASVAVTGTRTAGM